MKILLVDDSAAARAPGERFEKLDLIISDIRLPRPQRLEMKLLIVDDLLRRNLELEGYEVTGVTRPAEAIEAMEKELFNLVLTDIKMPGMSGVELLQELKRINPLANVIMMTGHSSMSHVVDCLGSGAADYFVKPFGDLDQIIKAVAQARDRVRRWQAAMDLTG